MANGEPPDAEDAPVRAASPKQSFRTLPSLLRRSSALVWRAAPRVLVATIVVQATSGLLLGVQLLVARDVFTSLVDADTGGGTLGELAPRMIALVAITGATLFLQAVQVEQVVLLRELVSRQAEEEVLTVATSVDLEAFEDPDFFDRLERARYNAASRSIMLAMGLTGVLSSLFAIVGLGAALVAVKPVLVPIAAFAIVPVWMTSSRNSRAYYRFSYAMTPQDRVRNYVVSVLSNEQLAKEVRAFGLGPSLLDRYGKLYDIRLAALRSVVRRRISRSLLGSLAGTAVTAAGFAFLVWLLLRDRLALADLVAAAWGLLLLGQRLRGATQSVGGLYEAALFLDDVAKFLDLERARADMAIAPSPAAPLLDHLEVDGLTFTYPGAEVPALRGVSLDLRRGEVIALVGVNGSGKTTLTKLIGQLYRPDSGSIRWNGAAVGRNDQGPLRQQISTIFQDFARYYFSASENVGLGRVDRLDDRPAIVEAARSAGAHDFLDALRNGYETPLSRVFEGGTNLSIGQWQRVALARMYFREASLVIMDEPTASLDAVAESNFYDSARSLCHDRALILVSHRFASVRKVDRIYVLDDGRIVEEGSHDELLAADGLYARLYNLQASAFQIP